MKILGSLQTPTGQKDVAVYKEMLIPLLFWCNRDIRLAVPSVAIPYGQRFIKVKLASGDKLVNLVPRGANAGLWSDANVGGYLTYDNMLKTIELYINNIFVNPEVHNIFIKRIGFTLIRVHRQQTLNADQAQAEVLLQQLKWPIEEINVGMKIKDYNSTDVALRRQHLDKWHTFSQVSSTQRKTQGWRQGKLAVKNSAYSVPDSVLNCVTGAATSQLRLISDTTPVLGTIHLNPFEGLCAGDIVTLPLTTLNTGNTVGSTTTQAVSANVTLTLEVAQVVPNTFDSVTAANCIPGYVIFKQLVQDVSGLAGISGLVTNNVGLLTVSASVSRVDSNEGSATVSTSANTLDSLTIKAHGIPIYNGFNSLFYNAYLPYHYGGPNVQVPADRGALFVPFNLYPGTYQPSGHINVSRAREFYLEYSSSVISTSVVGTLVVCASAINFLLISDGSAVLRYST